MAPAEPQASHSQAEIPRPLIGTHEVNVQVPLDYQLNPYTRNGLMFLDFMRKPERLHRARYQTESSRGVIKDFTGLQYPVVRLFGYNYPTQLRVFIGTGSGDVAPHPFYQACYMKNVTPCLVELIDKTVVLVMDLLPENNMDAIIDCIGVIKLRNFEVLERTQQPLTTNRRKSSNMRLVFRTTIRHPDLSYETIQIISEPIDCTQQMSYPEIITMSWRSCPANGGLELFMIGKNFSKDCKVIFYQGESTNSATWKVFVVPIKEFLQQCHMVCIVPPFERTDIVEPVQVRVVVESQGGKKCDPQPFAYTPITGFLPNSPVQRAHPQPQDVLDIFLLQVLHVKYLEDGERNYHPVILWTAQLGDPQSSMSPISEPRPGCSKSSIQYLTPIIPPIALYVDRTKFTLPMQLSTLYEIKKEAQKEKRKMDFLRRSLVGAAPTSGRLTHGETYRYQMIPGSNRSAAIPIEQDSTNRYAQFVEHHTPRKMRKMKEFKKQLAASRSVPAYAEVDPPTPTTPTSIQPCRSLDDFNLAAERLSGSYSSSSSHIASSPESYLSPNRKRKITSPSDSFPLFVVEESQPHIAIQIANMMWPDDDDDYDDDDDDDDDDEPLTYQRKQIDYSTRQQQYGYSAMQETQQQYYYSTTQAAQQQTDYSTMQAGPSTTQATQQQTDYSTMQAGHSTTQATQQQTDYSTMQAGHSTTQATQQQFDYSTVQEMQQQYYYSTMQITQKIDYFNYPGDGTYMIYSSPSSSSWTSPTSYSESSSINRSPHTSPVQTPPHSLPIPIPGKDDSNTHPSAETQSQCSSPDLITTPMGSLKLCIMTTSTDGSQITISNLPSPNDPNIREYVNDPNVMEMEGTAEDGYSVSIASALDIAEGTAEGDYTLPTGSSLIHRQDPTTSQVLTTMSTDPSESFQQQVQDGNEQEPRTSISPIQQQYNQEEYIGYNLNFISTFNPNSPELSAILDEFLDSAGSEETGADYSMSGIDDDNPTPNLMQTSTTSYPTGQQSSQLQQGNPSSENPQAPQRIFQQRRLISMEPGRKFSLLTFQNKPADQLIQQTTSNQPEDYVHESSAVQHNLPQQSHIDFDDLMQVETRKPTEAIGSSASDISVNEPIQPFSIMHTSISMPSQLGHLYVVPRTQSSQTGPSITYSYNPAQIPPTPSSTSHPTPGSSMYPDQNQPDDMSTESGDFQRSSGTSSMPDTNNQTDNYSSL